MTENAITPLTAAETEAQARHAIQEKYLERCLVGLDQFVNVLTDGDADETISARAARAAERGKPWGVALSRLLDLFQRDHGARAQAGDLGRGEAVAATELSTGAVTQK